MQVDGFQVEKFKCRVTGTVEITDDEGQAMRLDRVVVMIVAGRSDNYVPKINDDGSATLTRVVKLEHLALCEGELREQALQALITGDTNALQEALDFSETTELERIVAADTGEITQQPRPAVAAYAEPPAEEPEFYDVPVARDTGTISETVVVGHVRGGDRSTAVGPEPVDGPAVGRVSWDDLAGLAATPSSGAQDNQDASSTPPPPRPSGSRDDEARKFFEGDSGG